MLQIQKDYWSKQGLSSLGEKFLDTVALLFVFDNYCPTID
jgi:hypothetical protein